jgi:hypothetical protein
MEHWIGISRSLRRAIQLLLSLDMQDWATLISILTLLLYSITGQQVAGHISHAHVLLGSVTPEQLHAHEAEEAREGRPLAITYPTDHGMTLQGGIIVSLLYGPDVSRIPVVLDSVLPAVSTPRSTIYYSVSFPRLPGQTLVHPPLDPPPRFISEPA